ncbi:MAG: DUF2225 domain-containing protein [Desulfomonilaceae bacterium]
MNSSVKVLACPVCHHHFTHFWNGEGKAVSAFGYGLDFRLLPRDSNRVSDVASCPNCFFTYRTQDFQNRVPENLRLAVKSSSYQNIFVVESSEERRARPQLALLNMFETRGLNPRDLGILALKGSWVARELGALHTELELLEKSDNYLDQALRRGLTKGDPAMVMYLLGEINRRRESFLRAREMLTFLGNNPRYRYPALLLTVLIEEEDSTPYWSQHSPERMEQNSPKFQGLFPPLRSIPPRKIEFSPDELKQGLEQSDGDDLRRF